MDRQLHIVCLDTPWPADYGGAIDMMNRIMMLHKLGIGIHLHYFSYNERGVPEELNRYCLTARAYSRKTGKKGLSLRLPYIIASRMNDELISDLRKDDHPILIEGIHCSGILREPDIRKRKLVLRMHNEESIYYKELARSERGFWKKLFFLRESRMIRKYNHHLPENCVYACVSEKDIEILKNEFGLKNTVFIPTFPTWQSVCGEEGIGKLCLYHGNLSVPENEKAALWLLQKVFTKINVPLVIAGKKPSRRLRKLAELCTHTCLVADPSEGEMDDLVKKAQINVLPCFNKNVTGIRLKLLHALFEGRHCVVNEPMAEGTGLEAACHFGTNAESFASIIVQLYRHPFTTEELTLRKQLLGETYNNEENAKKFIQYLW